MFKKTGVCIIIFILFLSLSGFTQIGGKGIYKFLELTNSARIASLGGKNISLKDDDLNLAYQNPALLNSQMHHSVVLNYVGYISDVKFGYFSFAHRKKETGTFAGGIQYINYGKFTAANPSGIKTGTFSAAEYALHFSYSRPLLDSNLRAGVAVKPIISNMERYTSIGLAADLGLYYNFPDQLLQLGLVLKNTGHQLTPYYGAHYEKLPLNLLLGISKNLKHAPFRFTVTFHHLNNWSLRQNFDKKDNSELSQSLNNTGNTETKWESALKETMYHTILGTEIHLLQNFAINIGYNLQRRQELMMENEKGLYGLSIGFNLNLAGFNISYGRSSYHRAAGSNHFSVSTELNRFF